MEYWGRSQLAITRIDVLQTNVRRRSRYNYFESSMFDQARRAGFIFEVRRSTLPCGSYLFRHCSKFDPQFHGLTI